MDLVELSDSLSSIIQESTSNKPAIIVIVGGGGSGKSTLVGELIKNLPNSDAISVDDFVIGDRAYRRANLEGRNPEDKYDFDLMNKKISELRSLGPGSSSIAFPRYDEKTGLGIQDDESLYTHPIGKLDYLIVEGVFGIKVNSPNLVIYLDAESDIRFANSMDRSRSVRDDGSKQELKRVFELRNKLEYEPFVLPMRDKADIKVVVNKEGGKINYKIK